MLAALRDDRSRLIAWIGHGNQRGGGGSRRSGVAEPALGEFMCSRDVEDYLGLDSVALYDGPGRRGGALLLEVPHCRQKLTAHLRSELPDASTVDTDLHYRPGTTCQLLDDLVKADVHPAFALGPQEGRQATQVLLLARHLDRVAGRQHPAIATRRHVGWDKHVWFGEVQPDGPLERARFAVIVGPLRAPYRRRDLR